MGFCGLVVVNQAFNGNSIGTFIANFSALIKFLSCFCSSSFYFHHAFVVLLVFLCHTIKNRFLHECYEKYYLIRLSNTYKNIEIKPSAQKIFSAPNWFPCTDYLPALGVILRSTEYLDRVMYTKTYVYKKCYDTPWHFKYFPYARNDNRTSKEFI